MKNINAGRYTIFPSNEVIAQQWEYLMISSFLLLNVS